MSQHHSPTDARARAKRGPSTVTRRQFLRRAAAAGAAVAAPCVIPASALGLGDAVAPSERIVLGGLGIGGRGSGVLNWMMGEKDIQCVAVCDAKKAQREKIKQMVDKR